MPVASTGANGDAYASGSPRAIVCSIGVGAAHAHQQHLTRGAHRFGPGADRGEAEVLPLPRERTAGPGRQHEVEALVEPGLGDVFRHAEHHVLGPLVAAPHAEVDAALAEAVEHRRPLGEAQRVRERQVHDRRAHAHARRLTEEEGDHVEGVGARAVVEEVLLGHPHAVEPELLGEVHALELVVVDLAGRRPGRDLERVVRAELHRHPSPSRMLVRNGTTSAANAVGASVGARWLVPGRNTHRAPSRSASSCWSSPLPSC